MLNRLSSCRSLIARSTRKFMVPTESVGRSWMSAYWATGAHGPELYVLTGYCTLCSGFVIYNLLFSHATRNEWSWFPYINKEQFHSFNVEL